MGSRSRKWKELTGLFVQVVDAYYKQVAAPGSSGASFLAVCRGKVRLPRVWVLHSLARRVPVLGGSSQCVTRGLRHGEMGQSDPLPGAPSPASLCQDSVALSSLAGQSSPSSGSRHWEGAPLSGCGWEGRQGLLRVRGPGGCKSHGGFGPGWEASLSLPTWGCLCPRGSGHGQMGKRVPTAPPGQRGPGLRGREWPRCDCHGPALPSTHGPPGGSQDAVPGRAEEPWWAWRPGEGPIGLRGGGRAGPEAS